MTQTATSWWKDYFSSIYGELYRGPLAPELNTEIEIETIKRLFGAESGSGPILDICCGHGRHLAPLRKSKLPVVGIDYSRELLMQVPKPMRRFLLQSDMRALPFRDGTISSAYMLFNSFGYFEDEQNAAFLAEVARTLKPGGRLLIDLPCRGGMKKAVEASPASLRCQDQVSIYEHWTFDKATRRLNATGRWELDGKSQHWDLSLRLYTPVEMQRMLKAAGFTQVEIRPFEEMEELGTSSKYPAPGDSCWRSVSNMVALAGK